MPSFTNLKKLVKRLVGRNDIVLSLEESKQAREMYPEVYKQYLAERRAYNEGWKTIGRAFLTKDFTRYQDLVDHLAGEGYEHVLSAGFTGYIGKDFKLYTKDKKLIDGAPTPSFYPSVVMNPKFGASEADAWVFRGIKVDGTKGGYFYTAEFKHDQHQQKHMNVRELDLPAIRKKWLPHVRKFDPTNAKCVAGTVLEMLYQFTARIGTPNNSTFGISTLLVKHVHPQKSGLVIKYLGKDSVATTHKLNPAVLEHRVLIKNIEALMANKTTKDLLFTVERADKFIRMPPTIVNKFWRMCGAPEGVTVHKIRTWRGTRAFYAVVTDILTRKRPKTLKDAKARFKEAAEAVGKMLNHVRSTDSGDKVTGVTALKSYVDPAAQCLYWLELGYPLPPALQKYHDTHGA